MWTCYCNILSLGNGFREPRGKGVGEFCDLWTACMESINMNIFYCDYFVWTMDIALIMQHCIDPVYLQSVAHKRVSVLLDFS